MRTLFYLSFLALLLAACSGCQANAGSSPASQTITSPLPIPTVDPVVAEAIRGYYVTFENVPAYFEYTKLDTGTTMAGLGLYPLVSSGVFITQSVSADGITEIGRAHV